MVRLCFRGIEHYVPLTNKNKQQTFMAPMTDIYLLSCYFVNSQLKRQKLKRVIIKNLESYLLYYIILQSPKQSFEVLI